MLKKCKYVVQITRENTLEFGEDDRPNNKDRLKHGFENLIRNALGTDTAGEFTVEILELSTEDVE